MSNRTSYSPYSLTNGKVWLKALEGGQCLQWRIYLDYILEGCYELSELSEGLTHLELIALAITSCEFSLGELHGTKFYFIANCHLTALVNSLKQLQTEEGNSNQYVAEVIELFDGIAVA